MILNLRFPSRWMMEEWGRCSTAINEHFQLDAITGTALSCYYLKKEIVDGRTFLLHSGQARYKFVVYRIYGGKQQAIQVRSLETAFGFLEFLGKEMLMDD